MESFWQRWGREVAKRLEDWRLGLVGFVGSALLAAFIVSPLSGILYAAVVTSLVLSWSVIATWTAQRDEARTAVRVDEGARRPALSFGLPEIPLRAQPIGYGGMVANEHEQGDLPSRGCMSLAQDLPMPSQASARVWFEIDTSRDPIGGQMHIDDQAPCSFDSWLELVALIEQARARPRPISSFARRP